MKSNSILKTTKNHLWQKNHLVAPPRLIFFSMLPPPPLMPQENKFNSCTYLSFGVFILNSINCLFGIYKIMSYPHLLHLSTLRRNPFFRSTFYKFSICLILLLHHLVTTIYWNCTFFCTFSPPFFVPIHLFLYSNGAREWVSKSFVWLKRVDSSSRSKHWYNHASPLNVMLNVRQIQIQIQIQIQM